CAWFGCRRIRAGLADAPHDGFDIDLGILFNDLRKIDQGGFRRGRLRRDPRELDDGGFQVVGGGLRYRERSRDALILLRRGARVALLAGNLTLEAEQIEAQDRCVCRAGKKSRRTGSEDRALQSPEKETAA